MKRINTQILNSLWLFMLFIMSVFTCRILYHPTKLFILWLTMFQSSQLMILSASFYKLKKSIYINFKMDIKFSYIIHMAFRIQCKGEVALPKSLAIFNNLGVHYLFLPMFSGPDCRMGIWGLCPGHEIFKGCKCF